MVKLSWRDVGTALLVLAGAAVFWAKMYGYDWPVIESWRSAIAVMGALTAGIFLLDAGDARESSPGTFAEMTAALAVTAVFVAAMFIATKTAFIWLSGGVAAFWLIGLYRHARHSYDESQDSNRWLPTQ